MVNFRIGEEKNKWLNSRMAELGILEKDIEEKFIRSSGRGGQKVNKTSSCVYLKHVPSGIEVKCMKERSQSINRFLARRELVKKVEAQQGEVTRNDVRLQKVRKQKKRRQRKSSRKYETGTD